MDRINRVSREFILLLLLLACMAFSSCETFQASNWRAPDYDRPPHAEADYGWPSPRDY